VRASLPLLLALLACASTAHAAPDAQAVAREATWLRLLHVPPGATRSEVKSPDFFLSANQPGEPEAELTAALAAHAQPWAADADLHPRCRFPARYHYLASRGLLPEWREREPRCQKLERWARLDELRSASVLMVSGYFGNPASMFGHTLLRLNTSEPDSSNSLLDRSFNFGALVPENEPMALYIWRGLTGGYIAGFADRAFYAHDRVYSFQERRDFWDYELQLKPAQLRLLALHLYEITARSFDYYFLTKNCGYRLAELIELVTDAPLTRHAQGWYAPVELFHRLEEAQQAGATQLIAAVRYVPSAESLLRERLRALGPADQAVALRSLALDTARLPAELAPLPEARRAEVIEALLAEVQQRMVAEQAAPQAGTAERQAALLRLRLALPPSATPAPEPTRRPSIAEGAAPARLGLGTRHTQGRGQEATLRAAAFDYHALAGKGLQGAELVVLDAELGLAGHGVIETVDLARVRKLETEDLALSGWAWSWQTQIGLSRHQHLGTTRPDGRQQLRGRASFAAGTAWGLGELGQAYALLGAELLSDPGAAALQPRLGWVMDRAHWGLQAEWSWRRESRAGSARGLLQLAAVWRDGPWQLRLRADREPRSTASLDLQHAF
jgi:hypothetical protein